MMNVVFTGPAFDSEGKSVLRADLTYACIVKGNLTVQDGIQADTNALVASRTDTVKAMNAAKRGIAVLDLPGVHRQLPARRGDQEGRQAEQVHRPDRPRPVGARLHRRQAARADGRPLIIARWLHDAGAGNPKLIATRPLRLHTSLCV